MELTILEEYNKEDRRNQIIEKIPKPNRFKIIINTRRYQLLFTFFLISLIIAILIFFFLTKEAENKESINTCVINSNYRLSCGFPNTSKKVCLNIDCCYDERSSECYHYLPSKYGYIYDDKRKIYKPTKEKNPFENEMMRYLNMEIITDEENLKISLKESSVSRTVIKISNSQNDYFKIDVNRENLSIKIRRNGTNDLLLSTEKGPLITSDGYWEMGLQLTKDHLFGLDELYIGNDRIKRIFYKNFKDHVTIPGFIAHNNNTFHGAIIEHDGPLEISVLPSKLIDLRGLGSGFTINLVIGPTPKDIYRQLKKENDFLQKPWTLRPHICREGRDTIKSILNEVEKFYETEKISYATDCIHENLYILLNDMSQADLIKLQKIVAKIGQSKFLLSLPPQILANENSPLYQKANALNMLYKYDNSNAIGRYKNLDVVFPDFSNINVKDWINELQNYLNGKLKTTVENLIFHDNWPEDDSFEMVEVEKFPYFTNEIKAAMSASLRWNATSTSGINHYILHNLYGLSQVSAFEKEVFNILGTTSYVHGIKYPAVLKNIDMSWESLKNSLKIVLSQSLYGNQNIVVPVCGSTTNSIEESICVRWYIMAATMPMFRISSQLPRRDPMSLSGYSQNIAIDAIRKRESLIPYYNTILNKKEPITRAMFYEFPLDQETYVLDEQYMIGESLLVAQPMLPEMTKLRIYLPQEKNWYEFWGGANYKNGWINIGIVENDWVMFIAAGHLVPIIYKEKDDTFPWKITMALDCTTDCQAVGKIDYEQINLTFEGNEKNLIIKNIITSQATMCQDQSVSGTIKYINIYGIDEKYPKQISVNNVDLCKVTDDTYTISF